MLLAIDIGNTTIHIGFFNKKRIVKTACIKTRAGRPCILKQLKREMKDKRGKIEGIIISSVVPKETPVLGNLLKGLLRVRPLVLGSDIKVPIKNLYNNPGQVGQDRLVNAYACKEFYGCPAIVLDFGTATTLDYINKFGEYEGGIITAGVGITIEALAEKTALLPKIGLNKPASLIGKDTAGSIRSGLFFGKACMCDGLILKIKRSYKVNPVVVATGGLADRFYSYSNEINKIDKNLTLKGLIRIFQKKYHPDLDF